MRVTMSLLGAAVTLGAVCVVNTSFAISGSEALATAQNVVRDNEHVAENIEARASGVFRVARTPVQRLADASLLMQTKDYARAAILYSQVVEEPAGNEEAYAEALARLGDAYFLNGEYLSARRIYGRVLTEQGHPRLQVYRPEAFGRLTDVAMRTHDFVFLGKLRDRLSSLHLVDRDGTVAYATARILLAQHDMTGALAAAKTVPANSRLAHRALYLVGVITLQNVKRNTAVETPAARGNESTGAPPLDGDQRHNTTSAVDYTKAIAAFQRVTSLPSQSPEAQQVIDLAWLAIGRLQYEGRHWSAALKAYEQVPRTSPFFKRALYESATVYVELGDVHHAQQSLEVLAVVDPVGAEAAEASLLRGELELKAGKYKKADQTFRAIRNRYAPMVGRIDAFLQSTQDPAVYYDRLVQGGLATKRAGSSDLPDTVIKWARSSKDGPAAFSVIDEVVITRKMLVDSERYISKLRSVLNSAQRARAFPDLKAAQEAALASVNSIMRARATLGEGLDDVEPESVSGELAKVRTERRALQKQVLKLPVTAKDFAGREHAAKQGWVQVSQALQRLQLEVNTLDAIVKGLRKVLRRGPSQGIVRDAVTAQRFEDELRANEKDIAMYRARIETLRKMVGSGKVTAGIDDSHMTSDASVRERFKAALRREVALVKAGAAGRTSAAYGDKVGAVLDRADQAELSVSALLEKIDAQGRQRAKKISLTIQSEEAKLLDYAAQLKLLDDEARVVVGQVAMRNFGLVRDRVRSIVVRADVGSTEQAWEVREEQLIRVRKLQRERARTEQLLNEQLREVLDDAAD